MPVSFNQLRTFFSNLYIKDSGEVHEVTARSRAMLINVMATTGMLFCAIFALLSFLEKETFLIVADSVSAILFLAILVYFRKTGNYQVAGYFGTLCCSVLFIYLFCTGGANGSGHLWSYVLPIVALFLFGPRLGTLIATAYLAATALVLFVPFTILQVPDYPLTYKLRFVGSYISVLILSYLYERMHVAIQEAIEKKNTELLSAIGDHNEAREALGSSEARLKDILLSSSDWIWETDVQGVFTYIGGRTADILGYKPDEILTREITSFVPRDNIMAFRNRVDILIKDKLPIIDFQVEHLHKDGHRMWMLVNAVPVLDAGGAVAGIRGVNKNITAQKRAETDREMLEEKFRTAQKMEAIGQLAGGIAHDFNNILGAISGYAEMIRTRFGGTDPKLAKYTDNILSASSRAADLTGKLLAFARRGKFQNVPFNIQHTLTEVTELLRHSIDKRIDLVVGHHAENAMIQGDPVQIQNALMNLGINGADAMPNGGKLVFDSVNVVLDRHFIEAHHYDIAPGEYLLVSVTDTGTGMDDDTKARLFQPFFTTKELGKGTGLGLASVYGTVKSHNGYINVYSEVNKGTSFKVYLPCAYSSPEKASVPEKLQTTAGNRGITIMLVDDEQFLLEIAAEMLELLGYSTIRFRLASEAIRYFGEHAAEIRLGILDMNMPEMGGRECFKEMRRINPGFRALLTTGLRLDHEQQQVLDEGFYGVLEKPFVVSTLARAVAKALQNK